MHGTRRSFLPWRRRTVLTTFGGFLAQWQQRVPIGLIDPLLGPEIR